VQAQVLELLAELRQRLGISLVFITHDLRVTAQICDFVAVMQNGKIVEQGSTAAVFTTPGHPYTQLLLGSIPGQRWSMSSTHAGDGQCTGSLAGTDRRWVWLQLQGDGCNDVGSF
jgi:ABC-type dipeptide/oligopeptide/nickel transport system ATPase component